MIYKTYDSPRYISTACRGTKLPQKRWSMSSGPVTHVGFPVVDITFWCGKSMENLWKSMGNLGIQGIYGESMWNL